MIDGHDTEQPWYPIELNDRFLIADGEYGTVTVQNIETPITVEGTNKLDTKINRFELESTVGVTIQKLSVIDTPDYGVYVSVGTENLTIQNCLFKNIAGYSIYLDGRSAVYPVKAGSNIKLLNLDIENAGNFYFRGELNMLEDPVIDQGYIDGFEMAYCNFSNIEGAGTLLTLDNCENYLVHHNTVTNVNTTIIPGDLHARLFFMKGTGDAYNNKATNFYGNLIAQWLFSRGAPKTTRMYNNIGFNSNYYSLLEVQTPDYFIGGDITFANPEVSFNTACDMGQYPGLVQDDNFASILLDVYTLRGGVPTIKNNVCINGLAEGNIFRGWNFVVNPSGYEEDIAEHMSFNLPPKSNVSNEDQYQSYLDAGLENTTTFKPVGASPLLNEGTPVAGITKDFYGVTRSVTEPSIGAVE